MSDRYQQLVNTPVGKIVSKQIGLPTPVKLERYEPGQAVITGPVLLGGGGRLTSPTAELLTTLGAEVWAPETGPTDLTFKALILDATGIDSTEKLHEAYAFFHPVIRKLRACGRVIVLGAPPESLDDPPEAIAQRALEGLSR
jgi:3-oxoacyl-[acyl-carrier protein] reductase